MPWNKRTSSEFLAAKIIRDLNIQEPDEISVEKIASYYGAYSKENPMTGCEGRLIRKGKTGVITVNANIPEVSRKRFVIAHELGHFLLDQTGDSFSHCSDADMNLWYKKQRSDERNSNLFASALLMPETMFHHYCVKRQPSFELIRELADTFNASLTSTAIRYIDFCDEACALVCSKKGRIKWFFVTENFGYHIGNENEFLIDTFASDLFDGKCVPDKMSLVPASSWIMSNKIFRDAQVKEHSVLLKAYGIVLSLLWIDQEIEEMDE